MKENVFKERKKHEKKRQRNVEKRITNKKGNETTYERKNGRKEEWRKEIAITI